ncbi:MAG TPA: transglycosylase SLT domain-containing protein [Bryobacteraceae bacterium]|nr:transglycosylase SLT domain-containing protein [Bryobacteraceae bacterium]
MAANPPATPAAKVGARPATLAALVKSWREAPSPARRAAVQVWASSHPKDAPLVRLALGIVAYEQKDYPAAIASLKKADPKLAPIADYTAYFLAASRVELKDLDGLAKDLGPAHSVEPPSPFAAKAWLLEARAEKETAPADAVRLLSDHSAELPQPDGDVTLADCYQAAGDAAHAAELYQRVYYNYVTGDAAVHAGAALATLKESMGAAYPAPSPAQMLHRADRLLETRAFLQAAAEYRSLADQLSGVERDQARVRVGAVEYLKGNVPKAYPYLRGLELPDSDPDAERLYYLLECARHLTDDDEIKSALSRLEQHYPRSVWRLKAIISAANRFLLVNQPDEFVPLYRTVYQDFPAALEAAVSHWKVTFQAYLHNQPDAASLLEEHVRRYPVHATAGAALYFLGRHFEQADDPASARACYQRLASAFENHYYALLARQRLAQLAGSANPPSTEITQFLSSLTLPPPRPVPAEATHSTTVRIERSRLLRAAGLADFADSELRFGARTDGQPALLGMEMASAADAPHSAMHVMKAMAPEYLNLPIQAAPRKFWELLFPIPYRAELDQTAREHAVDPFLLAGLIRQESEFDPQALSPANAYGLTQVRPVTGRQFARQAGVKRLSNRMLFQPATNLKIGTSIFRSMLDQNGGHVEETLAAYNAGPNRLATWLSWSQYREPAEFVESIPFTETRDYVQAVLRNADLYRRLYQ